MAQFNAEVRNGALLAIIPARGGSKRVPRKNIKDFCGRPMMAHTVIAAKESGLFSSVVVSTDDVEIAAVARDYGAEVPFLREARLADDMTPVSSVTLDALVRLDPSGTQYTAVAQLMPNCPLRGRAEIIDSFRQFDVARPPSQISVVRYGWQNPWWAMERDEAQVLHPLFRDRPTQRSQDLPILFCPTGAIWWAGTVTLRKCQTYHVEGRTGWEIPWQNGIDIDTKEDFELAELLLKLEKRS